MIPETDTAAEQTGGNSTRSGLPDGLSRAAFDARSQYTPNKRSSENVVSETARHTDEGPSPLAGTTERIATPTRSVNTSLHTGRRS